ncbi:MAG: glutaredoxin family protein [Undibacterium sp.]
MDKKQLIGLGVVLIAAIGGIVWWGLQEGKNAESFDPAVTTYFFGEECPHCQRVRAFLDENKIAEKFSFVKREVWHDKENARLMKEAARVCSLESSKIAVPFIFSEGKCIIGEPQAIDFFKQKAGI